MKCLKCGKARLVNHSTPPTDISLIDKFPSMTIAAADEPSEEMMPVAEGCEHPFLYLPGEANLTPYGVGRQAP